MPLIEASIRIFLYESKDISRSARNNAEDEFSCKWIPISMLYGIMSLNNLISFSKLSFCKAPKVSTR